MKCADRLREVVEELQHLPLSPYGTVLHELLLEAAGELERLEHERNVYEAALAQRQRLYDELKAQAFSEIPNAIRQLS